METQGCESLTYLEDFLQAIESLPYGIYYVICITNYLLLLRLLFISIFSHYLNLKTLKEILN